MSVSYRAHIFNYARNIQNKEPETTTSILERGEFTQSEADRIIIMNGFHAKKYIPPDRDTIWKSIAPIQRNNSAFTSISTPTLSCPCYVCGRSCDRIENDENWRICYIIPTNLIKIVELYNIRIVCDVCDMEEGKLLPYHYSLLKGVKDSLATKEMITSPSKAVEVWYDCYCIT